MVDMEDIAETVPTNLHCSSNCTIHIQTIETHNSTLTPGPFSPVWIFSDFNQAFLLMMIWKFFFHRTTFLWDFAKGTSFVEPHVDRHPVSLSKFQEFALVLVKLRLAVPHQDLAYCLGISCAGVSRIPAAWWIILDIRWSPLIRWPSRNELRKTMPRCFLDAFGRKTTVIIDCLKFLLIVQQISLQELRPSPATNTTTHSKY